MITSLTERFSVDGVDIAWDRRGVRGSRPPLLLCHGFSGSSHDFALHVEDLADDREVFVLDHRGHGLSTKLGQVDGYSLDRLTQDMIAFVDTVIGEPIDLLGHSMGGAISLRFTLERPDLVHSLVLMDTSGWAFHAEDSDLSDFVAAFIEAFDPADGLPDLSAMENPENALIEAATSAEWQARKDVMASAFDPYAMKGLGRELLTGETASVRDRLGEIICPVTVIVGERDEPFVTQAPDLAAEVADGRFVVIPGAYHSPQLTHSADWTAALRNHLDRVD